MSKIVPTDEQKKKALNDAWYETRQFVNCITEYFPEHIRANENLEQPYHTIQYALLESWLLHERTLIDFFDTDLGTRKHDDVLAADYDFPVTSWNGSTHNKDSLNKKLSHLTYTRQNYGVQAWDWAKTIPVLERCKEFVDYLFTTMYLPVDNSIIRRQWSTLNNDIEKLLNELKREMSRKQQSELLVSFFHPATTAG